MIILNSAIVLAVSLAVSTPALSQSATDVLGVSLGMTPLQAKEALQKSGTRFKIFEGRYAAQPGIPESIAYINACVSQMEPNEQNCSWGSDLGADQVLVAFGQMSGKAFFVSRNWVPPKAEQPASPAVEKSVLEKYRGLSKSMESTSNGRPSGRSYSESKDLNGKPFGQCGVGLSGIPRSAMSNCGFVSNAGFRFEGDVQRLVQMDIRLFDHRVLLADIKQAQEIQMGNAAKQKAKEEEGARKASAPKL